MKKTLILFAVIAATLTSTISAQDALAEAQKLLKAGNYDDALVKFEEVLEGDDTNFDARLGAAQCLMKTGQGSSANFHAVKAEILRPDSLEAVDLVGQSFAAMGQEKISAGGDPTAAFEESLVAFRKAAKLAPKNGLFHAHQGWLLWMLGRPGPAGDAYAAACAIDKKNAEWAFLGAQRFGEAQNIESSLKMIAAAIKIDGKKAAFHNYQGRILEFGSKDLNAAAKSYRMALGSPDLTNDLGGQIAGGLYRCRAADQNWKALADDMGVWIKKHPKSDLGTWWQGFAQLMAKDHKGQLKTFRRLEKMSERYRPEAHLYQGMALIGLNKPDDALKALEKAAKYGDYAWSDDQRRPVFQMRVIMGGFFGRGDFAKAIAVGEKNILPVAKKPLDICRVHQDLGFFYRDFGAQLGGKKGVDAFKKSRANYEKAVAFFDELGEALPDGEKAQIQNDCGLMYYYYDVKDVPTAVGHYEKALAYNAVYDDALLNLGRVRIAQSKYQEAVDLLSRGSGRGDLQMALRQARKGLAGK